MDTQIYNWCTRALKEPTKIIYLSILAARKYVRTTYMHLRVCVCVPSILTANNFKKDQFETLQLMILNVKDACYEILWK